ncbi:uncharacterized protein B0H18DRAFT_1062614 [Fomitopsis serialis]|uniref:uncharacterized protein n=1 Tax=Fomitopsis serialis TaxID=139415 RepID=UPI00200830F1|nr:uncharacterized protein B0H18DRAFT_1062614 [Neoantrodia serialis]KAH9911415.1 hypothetical protein B0H18DRAFT_1062614 [Neoantrodia serialis]
MCGSEPLVAKMAWPHKHRETEDTMIRAVRKTLAHKKDKYVAHSTMDLKRAVTRSIDSEMELPRVATGIVREEYQDLRVCRTLILKRYQLLHVIGSAGKSHTVFVHVVRAHYWVYETSKILHRDINIKYIMWYMRDGQIIGVLCDWDLVEEHSKGDRRSIRPADGTNASSPSIASTSKQASHSDEPEGAQNPRYRAGTGQSKALDLLRLGEGLPSQVSP